jgi:signal transduction histidine kinase
MNNAELDSLDTFLSIGDSLTHLEPRLVINTANRIIELGENFGNWNKVAKAILLVASSYNFLEKSDSAVFFLNKTKEFHELITDQLILFNIMLESGRSYQVLGQLDSALHYSQIANTIAEQIDNKRAKMASTNILAAILSDKAMLAQAYDKFMLSLKYAEELNDNRNKPVVLNNLALIDLDTKNFDLAKSRFLEAIRLNKESNKLFDLTMNYGNLALVYENLGLYDSALYYDKKALEIARTKYFIRDVARSLTHMAKVYTALDKLDQAKECLIEARQICMDYNISIGIYYTNMGLSEIETKQGNYQAALRRLEELRPVVKQLDDAKLETNLLFMLAETHKKLNQHKEAYELLKAFQKMSDSLMQLANTNLVQELQTKYLSEKKELENNQLRIENQTHKQRARLLLIINIVVGIALLSVLMFTLLIIRHRRKLKKFNIQLNLLNQEIHLKNTELVTANQTKDKLFSVIAHDLKSPFQALIGNLEWLKSHDDELSEAEKKDLLEKLYQQTLTTYGTLENLLQWALLKRKRITASEQIFNLHSLIDEELKFLQGSLSEKGIPVENTINPETQILSDPQLVRNIVRNLLNNSIKFSNEGGKITISETQIDGRKALLIEDHGKGMSPEKIDSILSQEFTESSRGTNNEKGTGLGLQMVKEFARIINAKIQIESKENEGTKIWIIFPANA